MSKIQTLGYIWHFRNCLNDNKAKLANSVISLIQKQRPKCGEPENGQWLAFLVFNERERNFSLDLRAIRQSKFFGARRKAALRGEAYAWTPVLGSFVKLREVGVSSYLGFILYLSVLQCFGWFEALNGRLIDPKT